jgi:hypothetical protein
MTNKPCINCSYDALPPRTEERYGVSVEVCQCCDFSTPIAKPPPAGDDIERLMFRALHPDDARVLCAWLDTATIYTVDIDRFLLLRAWLAHIAELEAAGLEGAK